MSSGDWTLEQRGPIAAGMLVGAYGIEKPIGEGGMGAVYRALDNKLNRPRPPLGDPRYSSNQLGNAYAGNDPSVTSTPSRISKGIYFGFRCTRMSAAQNTKKITLT